MAQIVPNTDFFYPFGRNGRIVREDLPHRHARRMLRRISETTDVRIRLFNTKGQIIGDSDRLRGPGGMVKAMELDPPADQKMERELEKILQWLLDFLPSHSTLEPYPDFSEDAESLYPDVTQALMGTASSSAWVLKEGGEEIVLSAAAPVQRLKQILGVVYVTRDGSAIAQTMHQVKMDVLKIFGISLILTSVLSLYLSARIARPLNKLSTALNCSAWHVGISTSTCRSRPSKCCARA